MNCLSQNFKELQEKKKKKKRQLFDLFEGDARTPLPQAFGDNLAQICPMHATHGTIPIDTA